MTLRFFVIFVFLSDFYLFMQLLDYATNTYTFLLADNATGDAVLIDPVYEQVERDATLIKELGLNLIYGGKLN
jgi:sulfur dioxygenase